MVSVRACASPEASGCASAGTGVTAGAGVVARGWRRSLGVGASAGVGVTVAGVVAGGGSLGVDGWGWGDGWGGGRWGVARSPFPDHDHVAADPPVGLRGGRSLPGAVERVQVRLRGRDDDLDAGQLTQFAQFLGGELGVRGAAPADHVHLADLAGLQGLQHRLRYVRTVQFDWVAGEDPGHVHRDVADADDRDRLGVEGERGRADVRVPAVPVDEVGGRVAAGQVLPRDAEAAVTHRAGRVDHRVVGRQQVRARHVLAEVHAAEKPDIGTFQHLAQVLGDRLDRLVVGGDPVPDQPVRRGQPVEDVDPDPDRPREPVARVVRQRGRVLDQRLRRIEPSRA